MLSVASDSVMGQTVDYIIKQQKAFEKNPQIVVGSEPFSIRVNEISVCKRLQSLYPEYADAIVGGTISLADSHLNCILAI